MAVRNLRALCRLHKPDIIFLCETKVQMFEVQNPMSRMGFPLAFQEPSTSLKGGLVVACKFGIEAEPVVGNIYKIQVRNSRGLSF